MEPGHLRRGCDGRPFSLGRGLGHVVVFFKLGITFLVCVGFAGLNERGRPDQAALAAAGPVSERGLAAEPPGEGLIRLAVETILGHVVWQAVNPTRHRR